MIMLLPKKEDIVQIEQFWPILLNINFIKVVTNRITAVTYTVVWPIWIAFMPRRHVLERLVVLHETIHELHSNKLHRVVFKVNFEKCYDEVKWFFLQQAMWMKRFDPTWRKQLETCVQGVSVGVRVGDDISHYFETDEGVVQWGPYCQFTLTLLPICWLYQ